MSRPCRLDALSGRERSCTEGACAFWEPGGAVLEGRCVFEQLELAGHPAAVAELLQIREQLEAAATIAEERGARRRYRRLLTERGGD